VFLKIQYITHLKCLCIIENLKIAEVNPDKYLWWNQGYNIISNKTDCNNKFVFNLSETGTLNEVKAKLINSYNEVLTTHISFQTDLLFIILNYINVQQNYY